MPAGKPRAPANRVVAGNMNLECVAKTQELNHDFDPASRGTRSTGVTEPPVTGANRRSSTVVEPKCSIEQMRPEDSKYFSEFLTEFQGETDRGAALVGARSREVRAGITTLKELWQDRDLQMNQLIRILRLLNERLDKIEGVIHSE
jgi:hypothetical protein